MHLDVFHHRRPHSQPPRLPSRIAGLAHPYVSLLALLLLATLTGCGMYGNSGSGGSGAGAVPVNPVVKGVTGTVHGGQQPVSGATVQLWQVGTGGYGVGATALGSAVTTLSDGSFNLAGLFSCTAATNGANSLIYITATGGNPGLPAGTNNTAITALAALGPCSTSLTPTTYISINEVTTVAATYALAQFMSPAGVIGSYANSTQGLTNAFQTAGLLASSASGTANATTPNGNGIVPQAEINSLGNILSVCMNTAGPTSIGCTKLFSAATPGGSSPPTTIQGALLNIAQNPLNNVTPLLNLIDAAAPFQPTLASTPDWSMAIAFNGGGTAPKSIASDASGNIWIANYGSGGATASLTLLSPLGVPASNSPYSSASALSGASGLAIDPGNHVWVADSDSSSVAEFAATFSGSNLQIGAVGTPLTGVGLSQPSSIAIDPSGGLWLTNPGNNSVTDIPAGCTAAGCTTSYTTGFSNPRAVAIDSSGNAWVANTSGASITRIVPGTGPTNYGGGGLVNPSALAIDGSSNVWITDAGLSQISELDSAGVALSPSTGIGGGGVTQSTAVAVDGAGNIWVANSGTNSLTEFASAGQPLTTAPGFQGGALSQASAIAIDPSGNIWVTNANPVQLSGVKATLTEFVGLGAPAIAPVAAAVAAGQLGQTPGAPAIARSPKAIIGGPYSGVAGTAVSISGAGSTDPKDEILSYSWSFGDGAAGSGPAPAHTYLSPGTYVLSLTVTNTDGKMATATTSASIAATAVNPPVANAGGPYTGTAFAALGFNGLRSTDPANLTTGPIGLTYTWSFGDGSQGTGPTPIHTYTTSGTFQVSLTVTSPITGATGTASTTAVIATGTATAGTPTANVNGPYSGASGSPIAFSSAGSSDPNGLALTYIWTFGDGGSSTTQNPTYTYSQGGTFSVILTVGNGATSSTVSTVATITAPGAAALVANAGGPYSTTVNVPVSFNGLQSTNPTSRQLNYTWDFGDGSTAVGATPSHLYAKVGTYTVNLNVNDGLSANGNATTSAVVSPAPAEAITASIGGPYGTTFGQPVVFDATGSRDNLNNSLTYTWNFGDGGTGTGPTPTHTYTAAGNYTVSVSVASAGASANATTTVPISTPIGVTVTSPVANAIFGTNTISVTGTLSAPNLNVVVNGTPATVSGTSFTASAVSVREGVNLISATATDGNGGIGIGTVSVIVDVTPPTVSITSPLAGAVVTASNVAVAGLVNDSVTGTIGSNNVSVTVNGQAAQVLNRSYLLPNLQLVPGINTLSVTATDTVGNASTTTQTVQVLPATSQLSIVKVSGDAQTGAVHSVLGTPLVVQLVSAYGTPVAGRPITFTVTRSDGIVEVLPTTGQAISVTTDSSGRASVLFQLGSRSGLGINQVSATTPGAAGAAVFLASSTVGPPARIAAVRGDSQRGLLGQPLAEAFQVIVVDAYSNPVTGTPVTFTSIGASDGTMSPTSVVTDLNGMATSTLTIGQQEGINNYAYTADFTGDNGGNPIGFVASAYAPGPINSTSISGTVLDNSSTPVPNATVTVAGTSLSTVTNATGNFAINGAPAGTVTLTVDGSTATTTETLPFLSFVIVDLPGQNNTLGKPIYLPTIDINSAQTVGASDPVTLTMTGVPGLAFTIAPNSVTFPDGTNVGKLSISQVKSDMVPMLPSNGSQPNLIWTLQPAGTKFSVPVQVTLPNSQGLAPGTVTELYQYDHDLEQFVSAGTAHISADGSVLVSDPGFGITKAGWGHGGAPAPKPLCFETCDSTNPCVSLYAVPGCDCGANFLNGASCNGNSANQFQCRTTGICSGGSCVNKNLPDTTHCNLGEFCKTYQCQAGVCVGTPIPDQPQLPTNYGSPGTLSFEASFEQLGKDIKAFLDNYKLGFDVIPQATVTSQTTLSCCEATKTPSVATTVDGLNLTLKGTTPELTPYINGVPLSFTPPAWTGLGPQGLTIAFNASIGGTFQGKVDHCANTTCVQGGPIFSIGAQGTLQVGYQNYAYLNANISSGFSGGVTVGCGAITPALQWDGIKLQGVVSLGTAFQGQITYQLIQPIAAPLQPIPY